MMHASENFLFIPAQDLGIPRITLPAKPGKIPVALQFIIPALSASENVKSVLLNMARICLNDVINTNIENPINNRTKKATPLVTFTFYINDLNDTEKKYEKYV